LRRFGQGRRSVRRVATLVVALVVAGVASGAAARAQSDVTLTVSAAADLTPAFEEIGALFEQQTGVSVDFNFGSTGQLAQQIEAGAPVDVFAAANVGYIDQLDAKGLILSDTNALYARGRIVLWTRPDSPLVIDELADLTRPEIARIAIANPDHAPYGVAAREAMQSAGVWDAVQDRLVLGENVRDTLRYAETGNVDVAIVAISLAIRGDGRWTLIPEDLHAPIDQALAVISGTKHEPEARAFAAFVNGDQGRDVMRRYGFVLPGEIIAGATPAASPAASPASATPPS
jgi:molybdate transport system substrate-binding protein